MKTIVTHTLFGLVCIIATAWILANTWPTEPCAKVTAIVDWRVESWRAFEAKTIEEQDRYIASLKEIVMMLQASNKELAATRDAAVRKVQELQPVSAKLDQIGREVASIKEVAAALAPMEVKAKESAQFNDAKSHFSGIWKEMRGQALKLAAGRW